MSDRQENKKAVVLIQSVAKKVFIEKGYTGATVREIAALSGFSLGAIYNYFPTKKALFDSLSIPEMEGFNPDKDKKREEIMSAAIELFDQNGFERVKMDDIALAVGISKPTLYQFFTNKEALFRAVLESAVSSLATTKILYHSSETSLRQILKDVGARFLENYNNPGMRTLLHMIISDSTHYPEIGTDFFLAGPYAKYDLVMDFFSSRIQCDEAIMDEIRMAFIVFWGSLQAYAVFFRVMGGAPNPPDIDRYIDKAVAMFCDNIEKLGVKTT
jgi:Transcriptional regulator